MSDRCSLCSSGWLSNRGSPPASTFQVLVHCGKCSSDGLGQLETQSPCLPLPRPMFVPPPPARTVGVYCRVDGSRCLLALGLVFQQAVGHPPSERSCQVASVLVSRNGRVQNCHLHTQALAWLQHAAPRGAAQLNHHILPFRAQVQALSGDRNRKVRSPDWSSAGWLEFA